MEDNNKNPDISGTQGDTGSARPAGQPQPGQEILDELTELADKFAAVVRTAWNSEQRKQIENDVRSGLSTMATSIEDGFKQVATSPEAKDLQTKAGEVGEKMTSSKFFADLSSALTVGLRSLSDQLDKVSADIQAKNAQSGAAKPTTPPAGSASDADAAKDIPINKE